MSAAISRPAKRAVLVGSVWKRLDPNGRWILFEVTHIGSNPHRQPVATGKTPSGKMIKGSISQMESGDPRFEHVHDNYVRTAS